MQEVDGADDTTGDGDAGEDGHGEVSDVRWKSVVMTTRRFWERRTLRVTSDLRGEDAGLRCG